ncbi:MAG TPA: DNA repair protein RecO [Clostridia bacterium]|nr:DNA repair protein RecO [Clostridia bacterium]
MEIKTNAIALKSADYKENDKLTWLYSVEHGKICVIAKGVKKATAKLKFAVEPFCFGEYTLSDSYGKFVLTGCSQVESFYDLRTDTDKFYCGAVMIDTVSQLEVEKQPNPAVFLLLLKSLQNLIGEANPKVVLIKFILSYLETAGYKINLDECGVCRSINFERMYLDFNSSCFVCPACRTVDSIEIPPAVLSTLKMINDFPFDRLTVVKVKDIYLNQSLSLLDAYIEQSMTKIKSLKQLLDL